MFQQEKVRVSALRQLAPRPLGLYMALLSGASMPMAWMNNSKGLTGAGNLVSSFLKGVQKYRISPYVRKEREYETVLTLGRVNLYKCGGNGSPLLIVPSLINKNTIIDLMPKESFIGSLIESGFAVYMMDWGDPAHSQERFTLDESIVDKVVPCLKHISGDGCEKVHLIGYCIGGLLALASALFVSDKVKTLSLIATPWDFSFTQAYENLSSIKNMTGWTMGHMDILPVDVVQTQFVMMDPLAAVERFQKYAEIEDEAVLERMTLIEDWLTDGIALEASTAKVILSEWYGKNSTAEREWYVNGKLIDPSCVFCPCFVVGAGRDKIVPPESSHALAKEVADATYFEVPSGHIGIMAGRRAKELLYTPLSIWLKSHN